MKKICILLALLLVLAPVVRADVIYEPEDSFYWANRGECAYHNRTYTANGPENVAVLYQSPKSAIPTARIPNGESLPVLYVYEDEAGNQWGYTEGEDTGWVPLAYLVLQYDYLCFREEFGSRITWLDKYLQVEATGTVRFWSYPGSENCLELEVDGEYLPEYGATFQDDGGRRWGFVGYYYGHRNGWVCLDDPAAPYYELYADSPAQTVTPPTAPEHPAVEITPEGIPMGGILAGVGVLAALCLGFLVLTRKRKS